MNTESLSTYGSIACHFTYTKSLDPGAAYPNYNLKISCYLFLLLYGYVFHNKLTYFGPLFTTLIFFLTCPLPTRTHPKFITGIY